jgi:hypothetical protein
LTKTLDKFLKRVSDIEEEFTFMKADLNRVKDVLRKKLGSCWTEPRLPHLLSTIPRLTRYLLFAFQRLRKIICPFLTA